MIVLYQGSVTRRTRAVVHFGALGSSSGRVSPTRASGLPSPTTTTTRGTCPTPLLTFSTRSTAGDEAPARSRYRLCSPSPARVVATMRTGNMWTWTVGSLKTRATASSGSLMLIPNAARSSTRARCPPPRRRYACRWAWPTTRCTCSSTGT